MRELLAARGSQSESERWRELLQYLPVVLDQVVKVALWQEMPKATTLLAVTPPAFRQSSST